MGGGGESEGARDERGGAEAGVAVEAERVALLGAGSCGTHLALAIGEDGRLRRAHAWDAQLPAVARKAMVAPKPSAQAGKEAVVRDAAKV